MSKDQFTKDNGIETTTYLPGGPAIFTLENPVQSAVKEKNIPVSETRKRKYNKQGDWIKWGDRNDFPEDVMRSLRKSTVSKRIIKRLASTHVGAGIIYYTIDVDENGKRVKIPHNINEIEDFLELSNVYSTQHSLVLDLETYFNAMAFFRLDLAGKKVAALDHKKMYFCRYKKPTGTKIKQVLYSYDWPNPKDDALSTFNIYNPLKPFQHKHFVKPLKYTTSDETLIYELAIWDSVRVNGWMDVEQMVPSLKKHIFQNQAILKYHVKIPYDYWERKYGDKWLSADISQRNALIREEQQNMNKFLSGVSNSGKSFISMYGIEPITGKPLPGFSIEALPNKLKAEDYLPDASAAINALCFAFGYDPTNMGSVLSDKRGSSGSGSDKREALANLQQAALPDRYASLEPLRIVTRINKWNEIYSKELKGKRLQWGYLDMDTSQTLDQVSPENRKPGGKSQETLNA